MSTPEVAVRYLRSYTEELRKVHSEGDLYGSVLAWQSLNDEIGKRTQGVINERFLSGEACLVGDHSPTTAVGRFNGLVVLSANPGYDAKRNAAEMDFRKTRNRDFCESFFVAARALSQDIGWWRAVVRFAHRAMTGDKTVAGDINELWDWAADSGAVGAVDLVPFHSAKDGITGLIERAATGSDPWAELRRALRDSAMETFRMVLGLRPSVVVVASRAGTRIAEEVLRGEGVPFTDLWCEVLTPDWGHQFRYKLHHFAFEDRGRETHVFTMPTQLFSGRAAQGGLSLLRKEILPDAIHKQLRAV